MSNNEKFNILLNSCSNPRLVYAFLMSLASEGIDLYLTFQQTTCSQPSEIDSKLKTT